MGLKSHISQLIDVATSRSKSVTSAERYAALDQIKKVADSSMQEYKEKALEEIKSAGGKLMAGDMKFSIRNNPRYDYSISQEWLMHETNRKVLEKRMKQSMETESDFVVDGEIIPKAVLKSNTESISIK